MNDVIEVQPVTKVDACIIWLHGLGAHANDFVAAVDMLGLPQEHGIRFVFPNAPVRPITVNAGMQMQGWYDIYHLDLLKQEDSEGIEQSHQYICRLINKYVDDGINPKRILIAGFSQGGAIALYTGLRSEIELGGIIALSTYLPVADQLLSSCSEHKLPIWMGHGLFDPIVPFHLANTSYQRLTELDYTVDWNTYPMAHTVLPQQFSSIGNFIKEILTN